MNTFNFAIWSLWSQLSFLYRLYWIVLLLVVMYSVFSAASILKNLGASNHGGEPDTRGANLRQLNLAMLLSFGALFFFSLPSAFNTLGLSRVLPFGEIIGSLRLHFINAANVFVVLLALHCVQWLVSRRRLLRNR